MEFKSVEFELFRYQLLPITQHAQKDLFYNIKSTEDIRKNKNKFFSEILSDLPELCHKSHQLNQKTLVSSYPWYVFKLAVHKTLERDNENFKKEQIENWPSVTVIINNDPDVQIIAVSKNLKAFSKGSVVAKLIKKSLSKYISKYQLSMHVEAIFDMKNFWSIVSENKGNITHVRFELISPNMANISKSLKLDLAQINRDTNSHKTVLDLNSPDGAKLEINNHNEMLNSVVEYASAGGGDISFKISGYKNRIHTSKSVKTIEINEMVVENIDADRLENIISQLLKV